MKLNTTVAVFGTALGLILGSSTTVRAVDVTFRVNMGILIETLTFFPDLDTVAVQGDFNGWAALTLTPSSGDANVYEGTADLTEAAGTPVQYKFVVHQEDGVEVWEANGVGPDGAQNRIVDTPDSPTILPVVHFNNLTTVPGNVSVTFQVNLSIQELIGNFDPDTHTVEARGGFNDWAGGFTLIESATEAGVYQGTADVYGSAGAIFDYKYVINKLGDLVWEGNVGPSGPNGNRVLTLEEGSQTLAIEFFDNLTEDPGSGTAVTFVVNLEVQAALGLFDPAADTVVVSGQFNDWSTTDSPMTNTLEAPYVYAGTFDIQAAPGTWIPYKFVVNGNAWEEGDNRSFQLADSAQTLPTVYFNRQNDLGTLAVTSVTDQEITLEWTAAPGIRLQTAPSLTSGWWDVPDTENQGTATLPVGTENTFFRLSSN